jgi:hypothetical protein
MKEADADEAKEQAEGAKEALEEAKDLLEDEENNPEDVPEIAEMEELVEEAEQFAENAEELEEAIENALEEAIANGDIEEGQEEEFVKGLLDGIFGDLEPKDKDLEIALELLENKIADKTAVRAYNWKTGQIKYFSPNEPLSMDWSLIQPIFTGIWIGANELVVYVVRTIDLM